MTWQPIETAPKNGRSVDLWVLDSNGTGYRYPNAIFAFNGEDGMGWTDSNSHEALEPDVKPTHWIPLPEPPK